MHLPYWDEASQINAGKKIAAVIDLLAPSHFDPLLRLIFEMLEADTWELLQAWSGVFAHLPVELTEKTVESVLSLCSSKQNDNHRSVGGIMLGSVTARLKENTPQSVV